MTLNPEGFSESAKIVWMALSPKNREVIQARYPIKAARNQLIRELRGAKIDVQVLAELSGLSRQSVSKILYSEGDLSRVTLESVKSELKKIQKAVGRLGAYMAKLEGVKAPRM